MDKTPCELIKWDGLPYIRKELTKCLVNEFGLSQKETAEKLGITPAAVCQYLSRKRGRILVIDKRLIFEINMSAKRIYNKGQSAAVREICRLCIVIRSKGII